MRARSFLRSVVGAGCALLGGLLWLAGPAGAQVTTLPDPGNAGGAAAPIPMATLLAPPPVQPQPPEKPESPDLLELPLEELAKQPVRVAEVEAAPGVAAAAAPAAAPAGFGPIVSAASRREERVSAAPAGVVVIDRDEIVHRGYSQLTDVLRDLPGMETLEYFQEWGTQVPVRGIVGNNKIVVLVNGMRVNPPGGENFPFRSDFSVRFAERIEVVYGSGGVLYGQDAISAVINIVTKKPGEDANGGDEAASGADQLANTGSKLNVQMGADGGVNLARDAYGWFGGVLDKQHDVKYDGYVQYHDSNLTNFATQYPAYWAPYKAIADPKIADGRGDPPFRDDYGLNFFGRVEGYDSAIQYWHRESQRSSAEAYRPDILGFPPQAVFADKSDVLEGKNTLHLSDKVTLESTVGYNRYEVEPNSRFVEPAQPFLTSTDWLLNDYKYALGWQARQEETLRVELPDRISLLVGESIFYADIIPKSTIPGSFMHNGLSPVDQGGFFTYMDATGTHTIPRVTEEKYWDYSPYVEAQWQVFDRLRLISGARVTWDDRFEVVPITPRAAVVYNLTDAITAKYIYTQGFVAPAPYFKDAVFDNGTDLSKTNPNLAPEFSKEHDIVLAYNRENFSLTLNPYWGSQSNLIIFNQQLLQANIVEQEVLLLQPQLVPGVTLPPEPRTLVQTVNGGTSQRFGVDLYGKGKFGPFSPWFSYSYVDFMENNGEMVTGLPGISRHNGRLGVTWEVSHKLFVTPSLVIRSTPEGASVPAGLPDELKAFINPGTLAEELKLPYEINLSVLYKYNAHLELFANLRNITDHHYFLVSGTGLPYPQETFNGVVGLQLGY